MRIEVTKNVANHHTNPDYPTVRVRWSPEDSNFMVDGKGPNWVPRDQEVFDLVCDLVMFSPTFYDGLRKIVHMLEDVRRK